MFFGCKTCEILAPWPGNWTLAPALEGEVLTTGPPGKYLLVSFKSTFFFISLYNFYCETFQAYQKPHRELLIYNEHLLLSPRDKAFKCHWRPHHTMCPLPNLITFPHIPLMNWCLSWSHIKNIFAMYVLIVVVWRFTIPWTVTLQAPLSMAFPRQEYWSGLPPPSPGDLPHPGIEPTSPALVGRFLTAEPPGKPCCDNLDSSSSASLLLTAA